MKLEARPDYILFNQLTGIKEAIECILSNDAKISESSIEYLIEIKEYFKKSSSNEPLSILPKIGKDSTPGDLLICISTMQYALQTLLTEEEKESLFKSSAKWIGLATKAKDLILK
ncbi:hypothetical protein CRU86_03955 [Aliarcobacter skirrowii]|uniref:hypothetical protein n=1 Tax=Aliarcobacter skirrowii TaxID=28200 RepID=UPI00100AB21F|nr:hypothetical protein [Aliarcobacter skirrowii]RXJ79046.1 hypothetical protein CRU86_03955 [Aliarcobacter skirrowii]